MEWYLSFNRCPIGAVTRAAEHAGFEEARSLWCRGHLQLNTGIAQTCDWKLKIALVMLSSSRDLEITEAFVDESYVSIKSTFFQIK